MRRPGWSILLISALSACTGSRHSERPTTPEGYKVVELRDVAPMGLKDINVEVVAVLGPMTAEEICDGLITFPAILDMSATEGNIFELMSDVTLTLPRSDYARVRDLHPNQKVRVRGYLSTWFAQGCDWFSRTSHRYLWVDTIEVIADQTVKPPQEEGQHGQ